MKKVREEYAKLPDKLNKLLPKIDFSDTFATTNHENNIEDITKLIFNTTPKWVKTLFIIRNSLAKFMGLRTVKPENFNEEFKVDGHVKFFKLFAISNDEIVLGANDSHLNFRAVVKNDKSDLYNIKVITLVEYNNLKGKIYMTIIKPFHRLVVKHMVKNAFKKAQ